MDFNIIRSRSLAVLEKHQLPMVPAHFPILDAPKPKSIDQIVARMFCLHAVAASAHGFDRNQALAWLDREHYRHELTAAEQAFLEDGQGETWLFQVQVEALWALAWTLKMVDELDFWAGCSNEFYQMLPNLMAGEDTKRTMANTSYRPVEELVSALDLAYCLHWNAVNARLRGLQSPLTDKEYWIVERRHALEWLLYEDDWDNPSLDT